MPLTIVFDTNYLRSFGCADYLAGKLPSKLAHQIKRAFERGDLVGLMHTVILETNAWLHSEEEKRRTRIEEAIQTLKNEGFTVTPNALPDLRWPNIAEVMHAFDVRVANFEPTLQDYAEAERRTSMRLPPHPKKVEAEEMRDRLIWCQALRYSDGGKNPILIVSGDEIFKNGASSDEGRKAQISCVEGAVDFDQRLGERSEPIARAIAHLLGFADQLRQQGIHLDNTTIVSLEELRNVIQSDGSLMQRFELYSHAESRLDSPIEVTMNLVENLPVSIEIGPYKALNPLPEMSSLSKSAQQRARIESENSFTELRHMLEI